MPNPRDCNEVTFICCELVEGPWPDTERHLPIRDLENARHRFPFGEERRWPLHYVAVNSLLITSTPVLLRLSSVDSFSWIACE